MVAGTRDRQKATNLELTDQVELPAEPWIVDLHPDGKRIIVSVGSGFRVYSVRNGRFVLDGEAKAPGVVLSFDVSPKGDRIVAVIIEAPGATAKSELHVLELDGSDISHLSQVSASEGFGATDRLFSPRCSPDGTMAIVPNDLGIGGKGTLDDVLVAKLDSERPVFTQRVESIGDGLESLAFHPDGKFAVVSCLDKGPDAATTSHLAVLDLSKGPARLLNHMTTDCIPEGIEFSPDGRSSSSNQRWETTLWFSMFKGSCLRRAHLSSVQATVQPPWQSLHVSRSKGFIR